MLNNNREIYTGGACGGGKTVVLLLAALQYCDEPNYNALILRRTYPDLSKPKAIMDLAKMCLSDIAYWAGQDKRFVFESGAQLTFGHCEHDIDMYKYQSAEFNYIGFDEVTDFTEDIYKFLFSRLRRAKGSKIPLRMRSASNPVGPGVAWVKKRFVDPETRGDRIFIPSRLRDNPFLDEEEYIKSLSEMDPVTRMQLLDGRWDVRPGERKYRKEWFKFINRSELNNIGHFKLVRYWDLAASNDKKVQKKGSWTVGVLMGKDEDGVVYIIDVVRKKLTPRNVQRLVRSTAQKDPLNTFIVMEQEPGSSGSALIDHYSTILSAYPFEGDKVDQNKEVRDMPFSSACERGNIVLIDSKWNRDFIDELEAIPEGDDKDQRDAAAGAYKKLFEGETEEWIEKIDELNIHVGGSLDIEIGGEKRNTFWT